MCMTKCGDTRPGPTEKEFAEMANLAERWITGSASATVGAVDDELQRGLQGLQDDEQALRHGDFIDARVQHLTFALR